MPRKKGIQRLLDTSTSEKKTCSIGSCRVQIAALDFSREAKSQKYFGSSICFNLPIWLLFNQSNLKFVSSTSQPLNGAGSRGCIRGDAMDFTWISRGRADPQWLKGPPVIFFQDAWRVRHCGCQQDQQVQCIPMPKLLTLEQNKDAQNHRAKKQPRHVLML